MYVCVHGWKNCFSQDFQVNQNDLPSTCFMKEIFCFVSFGVIVMLTWLVIITICITKCNLEKINRNDIVRGQSTLQFNAVLDVPPTDEGISRNGLMMMEALRFAAKQVNDHDYLYGYKLALRDVFELSPWSGPLLTGARQVVVETLMRSDSPVLIGPGTSGATNEAALGSSIFRISILTYGGTSSYFDETFSSQLIARTAPSDTFRLEALFDMIKRWRWNHLGIIASYGDDGEMDAVKFTRRMKEEGVCVTLGRLRQQASSREINASLSDFAKNKIKVLILFTQIPDTYHVLKMMIKTKFVGHFHLVFFYGKAIVDTAFAAQFRQVLVGSIALDVAYEENIQFKKHFLQTKQFKLNKWSSYRKNDWRKFYAIFWQHIFQCDPFGPNITNPYPELLKDSSIYCNGSENPHLNIGYYPEIAVDQFIDAVYGYAYVLRKEIEARCNRNIHADLRNSSTCDRLDSSKILEYQHLLYDHFSEVIYRDGMLKKTVPWDAKNKNTVAYNIHNYVKKGDHFQNILVGRWSMNRSSIRSYPNDVKIALRNLHINESAIWWGHDYVGVTPNLRCSKTCPAGSITIYHLWPCCWNCQFCAKNHIVVNNKCVPCGSEEKVSSGFHSCEKVPFRYENVSERPFAIVLIGIAILLMLVLLGFSIVVFINRHSPVMKASGENFWYTILGGLLLIPATVIPYLMVPTGAICVLRIALPGLAFILIYASLFLKCYRINRTFFGIKNKVVYPSPKAQIWILFGIVCTELLIISALLLSKDSSPEVTLSKGALYKYKYCSEDKNPTALIISLSLGLLFMIGATVFAFKVRHYPHNHHETKSICYTLYISDVLWAVFLPFYYHSPEEGAYRQFEISVFGMVIAIITLFGLFGKKVRIITSQPADSGSPSDQSRSRNWSYMLKGAPGPGLNMEESIHDLKAYLDYHCPPQQARMNDDCEDVFQGDFDA